MNINTIYTAMNGEVNPYGIGSPTIIIRTQGCHLRCYAATIGTLCDTPEGLSEIGGKEMTTNEIVETVCEMRKNTGIGLIMLTGGDPLWRKPQEIHVLLNDLINEGFKITIETSGTIDPTPFFPYENVAFILDWKIRSAGIKQRCVIPRIKKNLREYDYIKFVIYDEADFYELQQLLPILEGCKAKIAAGVYWNGKITTFDLFKKLETNKMLDRVMINVQLHKLLTAIDQMPALANVVIPAEI